MGGKRRGSFVQCKREIYEEIKRGKRSHVLHMWRILREKKDKGETTIRIVQ